MLYTPAHQVDAKCEVLDELEQGTISEKAAYEKIHEIDPDDGLALFHLGRLAQTDGDVTSAKGFYWRALECQPCLWQPYMGLSEIASGDGDEPLSRGLMEIGVRVLMLDEDTVNDIDLTELPVASVDDGEPLEPMTPMERLRVLASVLSQRRDLEPLSVTTTLRPYRLMLLWLESDEVDNEMAEVFVAEQEGLPQWILIGLIRAYIDESGGDSFVSEGALAILGERGDATALLPVVECCADRDENVAEAAAWAFDRIWQRFPEQTRTALRSYALQLPIECRMALSACLVRNPTLDRDCVIFEQLARDFDGVDGEEFELFLPAALTSMVAVGGKKGLVLAQRVFREQGSRLSRKSRSQLSAILNDWAHGEMPTAPPEAVSPWTVYDICCGDAIWEDGSEDLEPDSDFLGPESDSFTPPLVKPDAPRRNDPCWCGSGKKYKKCHWPQPAESLRDSREDLPVIRTPDGDRFLTARAIYEIQNERMLHSVLQDKRDFVKQGDSYVWLEGEPGENARQVYALLRLRDGRLVVECNSRQRLLRAKKRLGLRAPDALHHVRDEFEPLQIKPQ